MHICDLEEQAKFTDENNLNTHYNKHPILVDGVPITKEKYNQMCDELTKSKASYIGSGAAVQGYICQDGRKVKFRKFNDTYEFGVYVGDDTTGDAITYFVKPLKKIVDNSNPFSMNTDVNQRYKSDLDGKFRSLDSYRAPMYVNEKKYTELRNKIIKGEPLT